MRRVIRIFPFGVDKFEVVIEEENSKVVFDTVVDRVEMHDADGVLVLITDGDTFTLDAYDFNDVLSGFVKGKIIN